MRAYFDTSAFVKLLVPEPGSDLADAIWNEADGVSTGRATWVEARAALAAAGRTGRLTPGLTGEALGGLARRFQAVDVVDLTAPLAQSAGDLAERRGLRGCDAVHLASCLALGTDETVIVTWDRDLAWAAYRSGLDLAGIGLD